MIGLREPIEWQYQSESKTYVGKAAGIRVAEFRHFRKNRSAELTSTQFWIPGPGVLNEPYVEDIAAMTRAESLLLEFVNKVFEEKS